MLHILVDCCEYLYSPGGASSYLGGNIGCCMTYIWFNNLAINFISKWSSVIWVKSLSINIQTFAISGITIVIPDIPVTIMFDQLTLICLNIQKKVSIHRSSFWIGLDIRICNGKHPVTVKCTHILFSNVSHFDKQIGMTWCMYYMWNRQKWKAIFEYSTSVSAFCAAKIHDNNYNCYTYNNHNNLYNIFHCENFF